MAVTLPLVNHRAKWELPGGIHDSKAIFSGKFLLTWLGVSVNEAVTRKLSLPLKDVTEYAAKEIAAQQKSPDSLTKVVHDNRRALNYLPVKQDVCAVANRICCT